MKTVFVDVDTQHDFLLPAGALHVPGAERLVSTIAKLNRWAADHSIPVVSTVDAHAEDDPEFQQWPPHCVAGTLGQHKPPATLVGEPHQYIVEKQVLDCFEGPAMPALLEKLGADRYVVYGVVAEICVRLTTLGLLKTGKPVEVVADAIAGLSKPDAVKALVEMQRAGARLTTVAEVCAG